MKKLLLVLGVFLAVSARAEVTPAPTGWISFFWNYESAYLETNLVFRLYTSTNITIPLTNWTLAGSVNGIQALGTNVIGTKLVMTNLTIRVQVTPGAHFFVMDASNFWGRADFSNVVGTPPLPSSDSVLRVERIE